MTARQKEERGKEAFAETLGASIGLVAAQALGNKMRVANKNWAMPAILAAVGLGLQTVDNKAASGLGIGMTASGVLEFVKAKVPQMGLNGLGAYPIDAFDHDDAYYKLNGIEGDGWAGFDTDKDYWVDDDGFADDEEYEGIEGLGNAAALLS